MVSSSVRPTMITQKMNNVSPLGHLYRHNITNYVFHFGTHTAEQLKINARQLLKKSENFQKTVECSVDIDDHKIQ